MENQKLEKITEEEPVYKRQPKFIPSYIAINGVVERLRGGQGQKIEQLVNLYQFK